MNPQKIDSLVNHLAQARLGGGPTLLPPKTLDVPGLNEAYQAQQKLHDYLSPRGFGPLVGYKIGCTTKVMQEFLSIDHPCSGEIFESTVFEEKAELNLSDFHRIGVECEIVARLSRDLPETWTPYDRGNVADAVGALMAGIELVDDRYDDYSAFPTPILVADDFFNSGVVLSKEKTSWKSLDLLKLEGVMRIDDVEVGRGSGADILGHPMEALAWLANHCISLGAPLKKGKFIMLGSVVKTVFIEKPASVSICFDELGEASVRFV